MQDWCSTILNSSRQNVFDVIGYNRYFICHNWILQGKNFLLTDEKAFFQINKAQCQIVNCTLLNKQQLVMGKFHEEAKSNEKNPMYEYHLIEFKDRILHFQLEWSLHFLKKIYADLKFVGRNADLISFIETVVMHLKRATNIRTYYARLNKDEIAKNQLQAVKDIKIANQMLAKVAGKKAFLPGNILEMIMVFEYFRDIYF
jgi:hypothetical protein